MRADSTRGFDSRGTGEEGGKWVRGVAIGFVTPSPDSKGGIRSLLPPALIPLNSL